MLGSVIVSDQEAERADPDIRALVEEKCSPAVLDFLRSTGVGRTVPMEDGKSEEEEVLPHHHQRNIVWVGGGRHPIQFNHSHSLISLCLA